MHTAVLQHKMCPSVEYVAFKGNDLYMSLCCSLVQEVSLCFIMADSNIFFARFGVSSESVRTDDLRDLLDDLEDPPLLPAVTPRSSRGSSVQGGSRCSGPYLAGTSVPPGMATAATIK